MSHRLRVATQGVLAFIALSIGLLLAVTLPWEGIGAALAGMWR